MFYIISPNRWLIWTIALAILIAMFVWWQIELYTIEADTQLIETQSAPPIQHKSAQTTSAINTSSWKTYRNEKYGFEFKYPPDLKLEEYGDGGVFMTHKEGDRVCAHGVGCVYPGSILFATNVRDQLLLNLGRPLPKTFQEFISMYYSDLFYQKDGSGYSEKNLFVDGRNATDIVLTKRGRYGNNFQRELVVEKNQQEVYRIDVDYFDQYRDYVLSIYNTMLSSLKFFEPKNAALP